VLPLNSGKTNSVYHPVSTSLDGWKDVVLDVHFSRVYQTVCDGGHGKIKSYFFTLTSFMLPVSSAYRSFPKPKNHLHLQIVCTSNLISSTD
jgi:hypothetical protein